jgi:hypothetical protein
MDVEENKRMWIKKCEMLKEICSCFNVFSAFLHLLVTVCCCCQQVMLIYHSTLLQAFEILSWQKTKNDETSAIFTAIGIY